jgi:predicted dienelactone hydrolase
LAFDMSEVSNEAVNELGQLQREVLQLLLAHAPITAEEVRERLRRRLKKSIHIARCIAALTLAACLAANAAQGAGVRSIEVPADANGPALTEAIWYPCSQQPGKIDLGGTTITGTKDCPIDGARLPLVVISHGSIGTFLDHHDTAEALADAGFIVAAISHRGDNTVNFADGADPSVMIERPVDIRRVIDYMLGASPMAADIDPKRIGFFGWSAGAYTGLVLAGARPDWRAVLCRFSAEAPICKRTLAMVFRAGPGMVEPRLKAIVVADPPRAFFADDSFKSVNVPVQLWASENGGRGLPGIVENFDVADIDRRLPMCTNTTWCPTPGTLPSSSAARR